MLNEDLVSIVVLNWNGKKYVHSCVESVLAQDYPHIEIIIVDNASTDGSIEVLKETNPSLRFIDLPGNLGFAKGMNVGISASSGAYVLPLNLDVYLDRAYVSTCVAALQRDPSVGVVGGKELLWLDGKLTDQLRSLSSALFLKKRIQGMVDSNTDLAQYCFGTTGSFPIMRKAMLDDVFEISGYYYDADFETGWEDIDLWFRMQWRSWNAYYLPSAKAWHVGSGSDDGKQRLIEKNFNYQVRVLRNRYFVIIKNLSLALLVKLFPIIFITELLLYPYFILRSPRSLLALCYSYLQLFKSLPSLLIKRKNILKSAKRNHAGMLEFFKSI